MILEVTKPGLYTTVQDEGRTGYLHLGIPKAGPMDRWAAKRANWLVGNPLHFPVLEITLIGPTLRCLACGSIAVTGANLSAKIDDRELPMNQTHLVQKGEVISFGKAVSGCRAYLAIAGEWQLTGWLGSVSASTTDTQRLTPQSILVKRQLIETNLENPVATFRELSWAEDSTHMLRIVRGPEYHMFDKEMVQQFLSEKHLVSNQANRMGYRLENSVDLHYGGSMISSAVLPGTIQITKGGYPILLMADAQTSGGYPRLFFLIGADFDKAGQLKPGDQIRFRLISCEEADVARERYTANELLLV